MPEKYKRAIEMLTIYNISLLCDPSIMTPWPLHTVSDNVKISDLMMYILVFSTRNDNKFVSNICN